MSTFITKQELFPFIKNYLPEKPIIIEAGAFDGKDTLQLATTFAHATIHAFEPVPEIFETLRQNTHGHPSIMCHNVALSDATGSAPFFISRHPKKPMQPFQAGSLLKPKERLAWSPAVYDEQIMVPTITLDAWAKKNNITHIDFAWLDLQGHELSVLKAAPHMLATMKLIYTEVHFVQAYETSPTYDQTKQWLEQNGFYEIAHDFKNKTDWFFGNALFERKYK